MVQETRVQSQVKSYQKLGSTWCLLNTHKVWIKDKVAQSREKSNTLPYTFVKKGAFKVTLDNGQANFHIIWHQVFDPTDLIDL